MTPTKSKQTYKVILENQEYCFKTLKECFLEYSRMKMKRSYFTKISKPKKCRGQFGEKYKIVTTETKIHNTTQTPEQLKIYYKKTHGIIPKIIKL